MHLCDSLRDNKGQHPAHLPLLPPLFGKAKSKSSGVTFKPLPNRYYVYKKIVH